MKTNKQKQKGKTRKKKQKVKMENKNGESPLWASVSSTFMKKI